MLPGNKIHRLTWTGISLLTVGIAGCFSTERVPMKITHPAQIDMSPYRRIAISAIQGGQGQDFSDRLKEFLVTSGQFQVLDRQQLQQILDEQKLSQSDLADPKHRAKIGKVLSSAVLISGHAEGKVTSQVTIQNLTRKECSKDQDGNNICNDVPIQQFLKTCTAITFGGIDVTSVETGALLISKTLSARCAEQTMAEGGERPCKRSDEDLLACAQKQNVDAFGKLVSSWDETKMVPFSKDSQIPDLEVGIRHAQLGELAEAAKIFSNAAKAVETNPAIKPASIAKAYWDLGLTLEYSNRFDDAAAALKKAYLISPKPAYLSEQDALKQRQAEQDKLQKQLKSNHST